MHRILVTLRDEGERFMNRFKRVLVGTLSLLALSALPSVRAHAQASIANPEVLITNVNGVTTGTDASQFIFRATITPSSMNALIGNSEKVVIDPFDPANPELGGARTFAMTNKGNNVWVAYVLGSAMNGGSRGQNGGTIHNWSIIAQDTSTGGTFSNGVGANPKSGQLNVVTSSSPQTIEILPVDKNFAIDKRVTPGQLGNGIQVAPFESSAPNDGGGSHIYTWRVRVRTASGVPIERWLRRGNFEWRDTRYDQSGNLIDLQNSPMIMTLIAPDGSKRFCPMEFDPSSPSGGTTFASTYPRDPGGANLYIPQGGNQWSQTGVYFRYVMVPDQFMFSWGGLPGEGPYTTFGGPTQPDLLPAIPIGANFGPEVIGRPLANQYTGFAGADRTSAQGNFAPPFPYYTDTAGRSGQWAYYFQCTTDLRPSGQESVANYPQDNYGGSPNAYVLVTDSDNGGNPGNVLTPYLHPFVTPILSDGGWTDDLPENGYAGGLGNNSHRSRPTTKTRVRFQVRVTRSDNSPLPANAVQVYIDGTPRTMTILPVPGNNDFIQGIVFYFDTTTLGPGTHWCYFAVDDGIHKAIWPRRDTPTEGTGDGRYFDPQAFLAPYNGTFGNTVNFGTNNVGKNYLAEPVVNNRPTLTLPSVNPPSGSIGTPFTYEITYTDADNDQPLDTNVWIDGVAHRMTRAPEDAGKTYAQGVRYRFIQTLNQTPDAKHSYYFQFRDNWNNLAAYTVSQLRREFGEWVTYPQGDDNGVPSSEISGPIMIDNHPTEMTDASYLASDIAHTPATTYDFTVRVKDADNTAPSSVKMYLSKDGGATWDGGTAMVVAENSVNYVVGVQYHLPTRIKLAVLPGNAAYKYRFESTDGIQPATTTLTHVGSKDQAVLDNSAHELKLFGGSNNVYGDPNLTSNLNSTLQWLPDATQTFVWTKNGNVFTRLTNGVDYSVDYTNGLVTLTTPTLNKVFASYFYICTVGPAITPNRPPVLTYPDPGNAATNQGTLTPLQGSPSTSFKFSVIYTDLDNQPPTFGANTTGVNVVVDTNQTIQMTMDPATPTPIDYTRGVKFNVSTTLPVGKHTYHFEASDGADTGRLPDAAANPSDLTGPTVTDPTNLVSPLVSPLPKGKSTDNYTFTITYKNPGGNAPPNGGIEVRLTPASGGSAIILPLQAIDPIGPAQYAAGVRFQGLLNASTVPPLPPGTYSVVFGFSSNPLSGTLPITLIVNGQPLLSGAGVVPNPASQAGDITFAVTYSDINGDLPLRNGQSTMQLFIDGVVYSAVAPTTIGTDYKLGVLIQWKIPAQNFTVGDHTFQIAAKDDLEDSIPAIIPTPAGAFHINAAQFPVLSEPGGSVADNNGTLTPLAGGKTTPYTFTAIYKHGDGVPPNTINLVLDPTGTPRVVPMVSNVPNPTAAQLMAGVAYSVTLSDIVPGAHKYKFTASDKLTGTPGHDVELPVVPGAPYNGPTVNNPPGLSGGTVFAVGTVVAPTVNAQNALVPAVGGNILTKYVFQVVYLDPDNVAPSNTGFIKVKINNTLDIVMAPKPGDPLNYAAGVVYTSDVAGTTLTAGQKTFHFEASDGIDTARFPTGANADITGLTVANIPVLDKVNLSGDDGTLSPRTGPLSTTFTYKVTYKHADNSPPAYVRVLIDGQSFDMQKAPNAGSNYAAGIVYSYSYRFAAGSTHNYKFISEDTISPGYVAKYPVDGSVIVGPAINVPVFLAPALNPNPGVIGQPLTLTSQLQTNTPLGTTIAIQLIKPDGSGVNDSANTDPATGGFTYMFTPNQTGDWRVRFTFSGSTGIYDPLTSEFPFTVTGYKISLGSGGLDMIGNPLIPVTPDVTTTFNPTAAGTLTPVPITALNLVRWAPDAGKYFALNFDASFPALAGGQGFWVRPTQSVDLNPRGKLWDQTQPYTMTLQAGWNMISSVYLTDTFWSAVKVISGGQTLSLADASAIVRPVAWQYNPVTGSYVPVTAPNGVLSVGRGYWVKALVPCQITLAVPGTRSAAISRNVLEPDTSLQVAVKTGTRMETGNFVPLKSVDATRMALLEKPPYVENYVTVSFLPTGTVELPAASRSIAANANVVGFDVVTDQKNADVTVMFPNMGTLGRRNNVTLVDIATGQTRSISTTSGYSFNTGDNAKPRRFALVMKSVTSNDRLIISELRAEGGRGVNTGRYTFSYNVSAEATVKAQIVSSAGTVMRDLDHGRSVTRGVNSIVWDGKDNRGVAMPSGSYTMKLTATDGQSNAATQTVQVILVR